MEGIVRSLRAPGPLTFEGNISNEWTTFKRQFEIFSTATTTLTTKTTNGDKTTTTTMSASDEIKIAMLLNLMGERAIEIFYMFEMTAEDKRNYKKVIEKFDNYCQPKDYIIYEQFKFHSRRQQTGEKFDNFLAEITQQAKKCNFTNNSELITDQMIRDRIVMWINSVMYKRNFNEQLAKH